MNTHDKRLFNRIEQNQQDKYLKELLKNAPDAQDKYDTVEVTHEPIQLLLKRSSRKSAAAGSPSPSENTAQE